MMESDKTTAFARVALVVSLAFLVVAAFPPGRRLLRSIRAGDGQSLKIPASRAETGTELIAFFITSSTCAASKGPELPVALEKIYVRLAELAKQEGKRFVKVGVAVDEIPADGLRYLATFGSFDELMSGGGWLGSGSVALLIRDLPAPISTPQLLVVERSIQVQGNTIQVSADRIVARRIGADEIASFARKRVGP